MDLLHQTDRIFFEKTGLDLARTQKIVSDALAAGDDGELFLEMRHSEMLTFEQRLIDPQSETLRQDCPELTREAEIGKLYLGVVKRCVDFGAFIPRSAETEMRACRPCVAVGFRVGVFLRLFRGGYHQHAHSLGNGFPFGLVSKTEKGSFREGHGWQYGG